MKDKHGEPKVTFDPHKQYLESEKESSSDSIQQESEQERINWLNIVATTHSRAFEHFLLPYLDLDSLKNFYQLNTTLKSTLTVTSANCVNLKLLFSRIMRSGFLYDPNRERVLHKTLATLSSFLAAV